METNHDSALIRGLAATYVDTPDPSKQLIAAKCRGLLCGYHARWSRSEYVPYSAEDVVKADLWNPKTEARSRSFRLAGKIDVKAFYRGRRVVFDHKSCSEDITDPNASYWRQLVVEAQATHYLFLEWLNGRKADDAVWDVMRKPGISPKNVTKADAEQALRSGYYFGRALTEEALEELRRTGRENYEMYEARLAHDCTMLRPEWYFQRRSFPRLDSEVYEYATELWEHSQEILHARRTNRHSRNSGACMYKNSPCKFLGICSGHDEPDSDNWARKQCVHAELPGLDGDGRDVLTVSRIRTFQTCRRKHYYEYELGIERQDEEEREALYFGTQWHIALEEYNRALIEENNGNVDATGSTGNELATARS